MVYLLNYNNYYNRIAKKESTLSAYIAASSRNYGPIDCNFNKADGINTKHTINFHTSYDGEMSPDYLLVTEGTTIVSRWFVLESRWIRKNQIVVTLRRDLVIDFFEEYKNAPFFCEKGLPSGTNDPYIYTSEVLEFNQVKTAQNYVFDDAGKRKWYVLYVDKNLGIDLDDDVVEYKKLANVAGSDLVLPVRNHSSRFYTEDAAYDVWVIPPSSYTATEQEQPYSVKIDNDTYLQYEPEQVASQIATALGDFCYDVQCYPYCPFMDEGSWLVNQNQLELLYTDTRWYTKLYWSSGSQEVSAANQIVMFARHAKFSFNRTYTYPRNLNNVENVKIDSETRFLRLCAPMAGTAFQVNASKIGLRGNNPVLNMKVNCTLKPLRPEIHIIPTFGGLYGTTFDLDYRGLRCGSDFSMSRLTSAWVTYENNNKSYLNSFDRTIDNIEITNNMQVASRTITSLADVGASMAGGVAVGSIFGPAGTAIGAAIGGITSAIGAGADVAMNQLSINETIDYTKDQFGYSIQSIKARPTTLARTSAFEIDSILWPFIELYESTPQEVEALKKKLEFNGFTIGRIGTFAEFVNYARVVYTSFDTKYIKGKLIRNGTMSDDFHIVNELAMELYKGVYSYL